MGPKLQNGELAGYLITVVDGVLPPSRTGRGPKFEGGQDNVKIYLKKN